MTREKALAAVDDAFADGVRRLFGVLLSNLAAGTPDAAALFHAGVARHDEAHSLAMKEVEAIFPE